MAKRMVFMEDELGLSIDGTKRFKKKFQTIQFFILFKRLQKPLDFSRCIRILEDLTKQVRNRFTKMNNKSRRKMYRSVTQYVTSIDVFAMQLMNTIK